MYGIKRFRILTHDRQILEPISRTVSDFVCNLTWRYMRRHHRRSRKDWNAERALKGDLPAQDGKNLIGLANQISHSMAIECKVNELQARLGHQAEKFGQLALD